MLTDSLSAPRSIRAHRLSANISFLFTEWSFLDRFAAAADAGFTEVEFLFPYDHPADGLARRLEDNGLEVALFNCPPGDWTGGERGIAALPGREEEFRRSVETALAYANTLGVYRLHAMAGIADPADPLAAATYRRNLDQAAELADRQGVRMLIEPINGYDMPGYYLRDFDFAADIVGDGAAIGLQFDIYHCHRLHGGVLERLEALLPVTEHIQIAGVPHRHEPAEPDLPLCAIFSCLDRAGYPGRVGCEYHPAQGTFAGFDWIDALEQRFSGI
jgi:hydroxypyruvate isomerase